MDTEIFFDEITADYLRFIDYSAEDALLNRANKGIVTSLFIKLWHIVDYTYKEYRILHDRFPNIRQYREYLYGLYPELSIVSDIANTTKHSKIDRKVSTFKELRIYEGEPLSFNNPPHIQIVMEDGSLHNATCIIKTLHDFWCKFIFHGLKFDVILEKEDIFNE